MLVSESISSKKFLNFQENIPVKVAGYLTLGMFSWENFGTAFTKNTRKWRLLQLHAFL